MTKFLRCLTILLVPALAGCERTKSANPLSPSLAGPIAGVTITPPAMLEPANLRSIPEKDQPVVLVVGNSSTTSVRPYTMRFELATDAAFMSVILRRDGVAPGSSSTRLVLGDRLTAGRTYYWRVRADDGANRSEWSSTHAFTLLIPIVLGTPEPRFPVASATVSTGTPEFRVANGVSSGPHSELYLPVPDCDRSELRQHHDQRGRPTGPRR